LGGWWDRRAGAIDPLAFVCELARLAGEAGAALAENTDVRRLRRDGNGWIVESAAGGILRAKKVLVATNAYSHGLIPGLEQSLVTLHSFQVATAPLPEPIAQTVLPEGQPVSDSRRILVYYRKTADGRLILGGRGRMSRPRSEADWAHLEHAIGRLYPALRHPVIEARWFGRVGMTPDYLPHIHEPEPGLMAVVGCQGRGIGLMTALGNRLADYMISTAPEALPFPITPIRPIRFHAFRRIGIGAMVTWYRVRDAWER
jgi:glycine/D-amino acid oxidase-like deaminating enzyme